MLDINNTLFDISGLNTAPDLNIEAVVDFQNGIMQLEKWGVSYIFSLFQKKGLFTSVSDLYDIDQIMETLCSSPKNKSFIDSILGIMCDYGYLEKIHPGIYEIIQHNVSRAGQGSDTFTNIILKHPSVKQSADFLQTILESFLSILSGQVDYIEIMFPNGSLNIIEGLYKNSPDSVFFNKLVSLLVHRYATKYQQTNNQNISILEIGAGIGSTSEYVLPMLRESKLCSHYHYTDITKAFTHYGSQKFIYDFIRFSVLDIQQPPSAQGLQNQSYDIVIATNVLHVTKDISQTLRNIRTVLKDDGVLIINEGVSKGDYATLVFGMTDGWWAFEDKWRIPGSPFITTSDWKSLLKSSGFKTTLSLNEIIKPGIKIIQDVIIAQ